MLLDVLLYCWDRKQIDRPLVSLTKCIIEKTVLLLINSIEQHDAFYDSFDIILKNTLYSQMQNHESSGIILH